MKEIQLNNNYFPALTGIRAIAAFMVYLHHFNPINKKIYGNGVYNFFSELHIGVTLFFVLSGFLITYRYFNFEKIDFRKYMINRFSRIYPMYFLLTTITFIFFAIFHAQYSFSDFKIYLLNITFLKGFFDDFKFTGVGQGWSLSVEEMFYISAPFFFMLVKRAKIFIVLLPFLILIFGFFIVYIFQDCSLYGFMKTQYFMLDYTFFGRCIEFFIGITLAIFIKKFENLNCRIYTFFGFFSICFFVFLLSILKLGDGYGTDCMFGKIINTLFLPLFGIAPLFIGLMFEKSLLSIILKSKLFQLLGKSSYVFYLIHMGIFVNILNIISENYIFHFVTLNVIAIILYQYFEFPINNYIRIKTNKI